MTTKNLELSAVSVDESIQARATLDDAIATAYADAMESGATFPPLVIFHDGKQHWLADGFHRWHAHARAGHTSCPCEIREGSYRDARLFNVEANITHGLQLSQEDRRTAVQNLLADPEWSKWSDREIARRCGVHHSTVGRLRNALTGGLASQDRTYTHNKSGKATTMNTAKIGAKGSMAQGIELAYKAMREARQAKQLVNSTAHTNLATHLHLDQFNNDIDRFLKSMEEAIEKARNENSK